MKFPDFRKQSACFAQGKPGLPRKAHFAEIKHQYIRYLKISKSLMRGTPGLPPLFAHAVRQEQSGEAGKK